jgi:hypothetical protein
VQGFDSIEAVARNMADEIAKLTTDLEYAEAVVRVVVCSCFCSLKRHRPQNCQTVVTQCMEARANSEKEAHAAADDLQSVRLELGARVSEVASLRQRAEAAERVRRLGLLGVL